MVDKLLVLWTSAEQQAITVAFDKVSFDVFTCVPCIIQCKRFTLPLILTSYFVLNTYFSFCFSH